jgi:hypothetical protein
MMTFSDPAKQKTKAEVGDIVTLPYEYNGHPPGTRFRVVAVPGKRQYQTKLEAIEE